MEFKEINVLEGIVQQIGKEPFAGIAVDEGNRDHLFPDHQATMMCYTKILLDGN